MRRIYVNAPNFPEFKFIVYSMRPDVLFVNTASQIPEGTRVIVPCVLDHQVSPEFFDLLERQSFELLAKRTSYRPCCTADIAEPVKSHGVIHLNLTNGGKYEAHLC